jgi:hypothetical protein
LSFEQKLFTLCSHAQKKSVVYAYPNPNVPIGEWYYGNEFQTVLIDLFQKREPFRDYLKTNKFLKKASARAVP